LSYLTVRTTQVKGDRDELKHGEPNSVSLRDGASRDEVCRESAHASAPGFANTAGTSGTYRAHQPTLVDEDERPSLEGFGSFEKNRYLLTVLTGPGKGSVFRLNKEIMTLGRSDDADISLPDLGLSRIHARFLRLGSGRDTRFLIEDCESKNGTFVAGARIEAPTLVADGVRLGFGRRSLARFTVQDALEEQALISVHDSALKDGLTRAYNRRVFDDRLRSEFSFAARHDRSLVLLLVDVDHFKSVNDTYGHQAGDCVLQQVATLIASTLRAEDCCARYGGEEFAVLIRDTSPADAMVVAERVRALVAAQQVEWAGQKITVTVSIGMACSVAMPPTEDSASLLRRADEALYQAKESGRNRICVQGLPAGMLRRVK
jgi:two-component system, cell cycle response regulator